MTSQKHPDEPMRAKQPAGGGPGDILFGPGTYTRETLVVADTSHAFVPHDRVPEHCRICTLEEGDPAAKHKDQDATPLQGVYDTLLGPKELTPEEIQAACDRDNWTKSREDELLRDLCALPDDVSRRVVGRYLKAKVAPTEGGVHKMVASMEMVAGILEEVNNGE